MISRTDTKSVLQSAPEPLRATLRFCTIYPLRAVIRYAPWTFGKVSLYDSLADHLWWLETRVRASTRFGATLGVDASDIVGKHIYYFGVWEPALTDWISRSLKPGDTFIDVGANVGYFSLLAAKLVGNSGHVVSIEALPEIYQTLKNNLAQNDAARVRAVNAAAWDKVEMVPAFSRAGHPAGTTTLVHQWAEQWHLSPSPEVEAKPLSMILRPEEIKAARLMKIDVEGAESRVISEMTSWLGETRDDFEVIIEVARSIVEAEGKRLEDLLSLFERFGFQAYRIENDYRTESCVQSNVRKEPKRIYRWPDEPVDQVDLILSRRNVASL
jgi:FkbM family methyltransferase